MPNQEGSDTVLSKGPCPKCGSHDNLVTYTDGHAHCFGMGCGYYIKAPKGGSPEAPTHHDHVTGSLLHHGSEHPSIKSRGLDAKTLTRYGYFVAKYNGKDVWVAPYYTLAGDLALQKLRFPDKSFVVLKGTAGVGINECQLFGRHVYGDRYDRRLVVTEGELDALSVAQALQFKTAVVSVNSGAGTAAKCLKANYLWADRFDEIVLWFDADQPGRDAMEECAKLFKVGKVKLANAGEGFKDASDLLQAHLPGDIEAAIYKAQAWRPRGIINAGDTPEDVLAPRLDDENAWSYPWPWAMVTDKVGPMLPGQVIYHVAGTGVGKTTALAEVEYALLRAGCKLGHMGFEDTRRDVKLRLMGVASNHRLDLDPFEDAEMAAVHQDLFGSHQMELFDPETAEWTIEAILGYVRYLAKALDCRVIFMDPLSFIVAGMPGEMDERRALDRVSRDLAALAKELAVCLHVSHHLTRPEGVGHEEGAPTSLKEVRGSGGIANFATEVFGYERNQQAEGDGFLVTQVRCLKNRPRSITGIVGSLKYSLETGRLSPTADRFPGPQKAGGSRHREPPPDFSPAEY
jgi:DNA helicase/primase-like protein/Toprim domain-containing protein/DnaB helicase-like protein